MLNPDPSRKLRNTWIMELQYSQEEIREARTLTKGAWTFCVLHKYVQANDS